MLASRHSETGLLVAILLLSPQCLVQAGITGLAVYGDSLSDEYQYQTYSYARNWVEQLAVDRSVNVGPVGNWGEPRRQGYEYNWSRLGARSSDLLAAQLLLPQWDDALLSGNASHAVLFVGSNDFFPSFGTPYDRIYRGDWTSQQIANSVDAFVGRIDALVDSIQATGRPLVLVTPPDYGVSPSTRSSYPDAARREAVSTVMRTINQQLDQLAQDKQMVIVDALDLTHDVFGPNATPNTVLAVGGVNIQLMSGGVAATNAFVNDGTHPHTVVQGLLANLIMTGLNEYGAGLTLFSEQEVLSKAGLTYTDDTLPFSYAPYVRSYVVPEPSTFALTVLGMLGLSIVAWRKQHRLA